MMRWKEELLIIQEEMRWVIAYQQWKATWWREHNFLHGDPAIVSGVSGYAHKQAAICIQMAEQFALYWLPQLKEKGIVPSWASDYDLLLNKLAMLTLEQDVEEAVLDDEGAEVDIDYDYIELDIEEAEEDDLFDFAD
jgi:hypothetical protein